MADINLLAYRKQSKISLGEVNKLFKALSLLFALLFFVSCLLLVFLIVYNQSFISSLRENEALLQRELESLSDVEKKYYFVKDRVAKGITILESRNSLKRLDDVRLLLGVISPSKLEKVDVDSKSISLSLTTGDYGEIYGFMAALKQNQTYKKVVLQSFSFSPDKGYTVDVSLEI